MSVQSRDHAHSPSGNKDTKAPCSFSLNLNHWIIVLYLLCHNNLTSLFYLRPENKNRQMTHRPVIRPLRTGAVAPWWSLQIQVWVCEALMWFRDTTDAQMANKAHLLYIWLIFKLLITFLKFCRFSERICEDASVCIKAQKWHHILAH